MDVQVKAAEREELVRIWDRNVQDHPEDPRWVDWREQYLADNQSGICQTFLVLADGEPVGEGTLLLSPECGGIRGRLDLADGKHVANINALRIQSVHEGKGQISRLVRLMEESARARGLRELTIGVEAQETRTLAIYLHWGYTRLVRFEEEEGSLVLYYAKAL